MSDPLELENVITDAVSDAELAPEPIETDETSSESTEASISTETPEETPQDSLESTPEVPSTPDPSVPSPAASKDQTDFEKKYGIPALSSSGRENRIPHSRVVKITAKAVKEAVEAKTKEFETSHVPVAKYQEAEAQVKDYTERLTKVAEFENVMLNDAPKFLDMLSTIPAYAKIFKELIDGAQKGKVDPTIETKPTVTDPSDEMPQPDQELTDGSFVYSMEGLKALQAWNRAQAKKDILQEVEKTYGPLAKDYQRYQQTQAVLPQVQAQIADARTWPQFTENEAEIVDVLNKYPQASLERAYQHVVWPKLQAEQERLKKEVDTKANEGKVNRDAIRAEILAELKKAPRSTSVGQGGSFKPAPSTSTGPRNMEDVIAEAIKGITA